MLWQYYGHQQTLNPNSNHNRNPWPWAMIPTFNPRQFRVTIENIRVHRTVSSKDREKTDKRTKDATDCFIFLVNAVGKQQHACLLFQQTTSNPVNKLQLCTVLSRAYTLIHGSMIAITVWRWLVIFTRWWQELLATQHKTFQQGMHSATHIVFSGCNIAIFVRPCTYWTSVGYKGQFWTNFALVDRSHKNKVVVITMYAH